MCPLCLGTATLVASGSTSAGGLALVLLRERFPALARRLRRQAPPLKRDIGLPVPCHGLPARRPGK
jgi:hypothetical protein